MKKSIFKVISVLAAAFLICSCANRHSIKVVSGEEYLEECPKSAKAGDTVRVRTAIVLDADVYLNGNDDLDIQYVNGVYEFIMPDHDVELEITVVGNGLA